MKLALTPLVLAVTIWETAAVLAWGPAPHAVAPLVLLAAYGGLLLVSVFVRK